MPHEGLTGIVLDQTQRPIFHARTPIAVHHELLTTSNRLQDHSLTVVLPTFGIFMT